MWFSVDEDTDRGVACRSVSKLPAVRVSAAGCSLHAAREVHVRAAQSTFAFSTFRLCVGVPPIARIIITSAK